MPTKAWPYDADLDDPLTKLRIPVTSEYPQWRYIATFDRSSEARPTEQEAAQFSSYIEHYKDHFFGDGWYTRKLEERPFDIDAVTRVFHKWAEDDWSYRIVTWEYGPFWVPVAPRLRGGEYDYSKIQGPLSLVEVMDRDKTIGDDGPVSWWVEWKSAHPEVFGG